MDTIRRILELLGGYKWLTALSFVLAFAQMAPAWWCRASSN